MEVSWVFLLQCSHPARPCPPILWELERRKEELPFLEAEVNTQRILLFLSLNYRSEVKVKVFQIRKHRLLGALFIVSMV